MNVTSTRCCRQGSQKQSELKDLLDEKLKLLSTFDQDRITAFPPSNYLLGPVRPNPSKVKGRFYQSDPFSVITRIQPPDHRAAPRQEIRTRHEEKTSEDNPTNHPFKVDLSNPAGIDNPPLKPKNTRATDAHRPRKKLEVIEIPKKSNSSKENKRDLTLDQIFEFIAGFISKVVKHEPPELQKKWRALSIQINQALTALDED